MTEEIINSDGSRNWEANILLDNIKRLEQENEILKSNTNVLNDYITKNEQLKTNIDSLVKINESLKQENRELKAYKDVNEDFKKAWDELNKKYTEVLKLAKLNADSNEYCLRKLEKENKALKSLNKTICEDCSKEIKVYWNALEEIKHGILHIPPFDKQSAQMIEALLKLINEVLG